jgi:glycosyltransferase involved in cell wall biosynthesis
MTHPPRIGIDYTAAIHQTAGIGRMVREVTRALSDQRPGADVRLFVAGAPRRLPAFPGGYRYCPSRLSERSHARLWHRLHLPAPVELWTGRLDLYHATDFALPPTLPGARTVLTIPDLAFERYPDDAMPGMLHYLKTVVPRAAARADHIIAISQATREELIHIYGMPPDRITAVPLGVDSRFNAHPSPDGAAALRRKYSLPDRPLILTVGTLQPRKNHLRLVQAFARVRADAALVIAGGAGWLYDAVHEEVEKLGLSDRVIFTGFLDDADLPALYRAAALLAYPALYEGFGLPVLEAMACGTPVLTSAISSLPEVAGDAALLVNPLDVQAIASGIERLLNDEAMRAALREKGAARAAEYTWARTAERVWSIYERLLAGDL